MIASRDLRNAGTDLALAAKEPNGTVVKPKQSQNTTMPELADESLYLIGRPTLKQFIRFVKREAIAPTDDATLIEEWQAAKNHIRTLEKEEAGHADHPVINPIEVGGKYKPLLVEFLNDPLVRHGFNTVPTEVAFVELDRLVVYQHHIDLTFVRHLQQKLGPTPSDEDIFRTCLPYDHPQPPAKWSRVDDGTFVFLSPSNDMRFLGPMRLRSGNLQDYPPPGALVGVLGLAVGFGCNFLNAIQVENRLILNNGSHRAYALRDMGFTHVPCVVQHVSTRDELDLVAPAPVRRDPDNFLKGTRPSMLKDYLNPKLRKVLPVHRRLKQITVKFEVSEVSIPAL
jgi:hypothetical protein